MGAGKNKAQPGTSRKRSSAKAGREFPFGSFALMCVFMGIVLSAAFGKVWLTQKCRSLTYRISKIEQEIDKEHEITRRLKVEVAGLTSLKRIEHIAKNELGLTNPAPDQIVIVP